MQDFVTSGRLVTPSVNFDRHARTGFVDGNAGFVAKRPHTGPGVTCHDDSTLPEGASSNEDGRNATCLLCGGFQDPTLDSAVGISTVVENLTESHSCFFKLVHALSSLARHLYNLGVTTKVFDFNTVTSKILFDALDVG